jgi:hypothetical protein
VEHEPRRTAPFPNGDVRPALVPQEGALVPKKDKDAVTTVSQVRPTPRTPTEPHGCIPAASPYSTDALGRPRRRGHLQGTRVDGGEPEALDHRAEQFFGALVVASVKQDAPASAGDGVVSKFGGVTIMATRKRHSPEQVVRKLTTADRLLGEVPLRLRHRDAFGPQALRARFRAG